MTRRTGLGRHSGMSDAAGDPLDGLVNLFDIGIVLAVAFLIAGLGLTVNQSTHRLEQRTPTQHTQTLPSPTSAPVASGHGQPVGTVYRLSDGQLVYVQKQP
jgi:hypothetical protein